MWAPLGTLSWDGCRVLRAFQGFLGSRDRVPPQGGQLARTRPEDQAQGARRANIPTFSSFATEGTLTSRTHGLLYGFPKVLP